MLQGEFGGEGGLQVLDGGCSQIHTRYFGILSLRVCVCVGLRDGWKELTDAGGPFSVCVRVCTEEEEN